MKKRNSVNNNFKNNLIAFGRNLWLASLGAIVTIGNESRNVFNKVKLSVSGIEKKDSMKQAVRDKVDMARNWSLGVVRNVSGAFQRVKVANFARFQRAMA